MPDPSEELQERIDHLKAGLVAVTRGNAADLTEEEYRATRKLLLGHPRLRSRVPDWLRTASTLVEANSLIRTEGDKKPGGRWMNRAKMIAEGLNPLLEELREESAVFETSGDLGERIGGGGFGEVHKWRHKFVDMDFAIKILKPSFPEEDTRYLDRFFREARILLKLIHPNVVRVYDVGMIGRRPFIRMELLEGEDLAGLLKRKGPLDPKEAATVALAVAEALAYAHSQKVVHRDVKPSNVFVAKDRRICLIDFGLGAFVEGDLVSRITKTGEAAVGGLFTAPELTADPRWLDPRADLYSLGAVWFNLLTGRPPAGTSVRRQLDSLENLSTRYKAVVERCLADVDDRHQTAGELADSIKLLLEDANE